MKILIYKDQFIFDVTRKDDKVHSFGNVLLLDELRLFMKQTNLGKCDSVVQDYEIKMSKCIRSLVHVID